MTDQAYLHRQENRRIDKTTDWLKVFPGSEAILISRLREHIANARELKQYLVDQLVRVESRTDYDENTKLFLTEFYKGVFIQKVAEEYRLADELFSIYKRHRRTPAEKTQQRLDELAIATARDALIVDLAEQEGLNVQNAGGTFKISCPFHDEKTPSCYLYPEDGHFHCFGCGAHGDVIEFVKRLKNLDFQEAVAYLR